MKVLSKGICCPILHVTTMLLGTWFSAGLVVLDEWLDLMILKDFSHLNDSVILCSASPCLHPHHRANGFENRDEEFAGRGTTSWWLLQHRCADIYVYN